jgi:hypothetical protein
MVITVHLVQKAIENLNAQEGEMLIFISGVKPNGEISYDPIE